MTSKFPRLSRYQNAQGKVIPMHHAFKTVSLNKVSRSSAVVLPVFFMAFVWLFMPVIMWLWADIFNFWMTHLFNGHVGYSTELWLGKELSVPYPLLEAEDPTRYAVWMNLIICAVVFLLSFLLPRRALPITYLFRTIMLIQASASIDRLTISVFPYTMQIYLTDALMLCVYMLMVIPMLLGLVYYIFDFTLWRKIALTLLILGYFVVFVPCQYMLHAYIIHEFTFLFLPLMYIFFGVLIDVLMFISIYAYGMSWRSKAAAVQGRGVE